MSWIFQLAAGGLKATAYKQQGEYEKQSYELKAQQARLDSRQAALEGRQNALVYSNQALTALENVRRLSATLVASAAAGGIDPFSGSPMSVDRYDAFLAGKEYNLGVENADMAMAGGLYKSQILIANADQYEFAGKQAEWSGNMNAAVAVVDATAKAIDSFDAAKVD